jgi:chemotaxis signal transduction protein
MNLRGEILMVMDITPLLKLQSLLDQKEIVVLQYKQKRIALAVQQIENLHSVANHNITPLQDSEEKHAYCKSLLRDGDVVAGILDLEAMLSGDVLVVDA